MKKIIATVVLAVSIASAAPAHADNETGFLAELNTYGWTITDTAQILRNGYAVCAALRMGTHPEDVSRNLYNATGKDIPTQQAARTFVIAAADQLCPELGWELS